ARSGGSRATGPPFLPGALAEIHGGARRPKQAPRVGRMDRKGPHAKARRDLSKIDVLALELLAGLDRLAYGLREPLRLVRFRVREHDHELVAPEASRDVPGPHQAADRPSDLRDRPGAREMSVPIYHSLEVVEIQGYEGHGTTLRQCGRKALVEVPGVAEARQIIGDRREIRLAIKRGILDGDRRVIGEGLRE